MITIIFGPPRIGKTVLMTHLLIEAMFDKERNQSMRKTIEAKNLGGFCLEPPKHVVYANYHISCKKLGYHLRQSYFVNPFMLGFANEFGVDTHFIPPHAVIGITEGQKYFDSRKSKDFPAWASRWFEQHGHNYLDIYIDVQRWDLIDKNIRDLACFVEIIEKKDVIKYGRLVGIKWVVREFESSSAVEQYMSSGKKDKATYTVKKLTANYNVHKHYNSRMCEPKFYDGHFNQDIHKQLTTAPKQTLDGYMEYLASYDDEMPDGYMTKQEKILRVRR